MQDNFARFGKGFQEKICHLCLIDRSYADQFGEVLEYEFFELEYLQSFLKLIYNYRTKYKVHPTYNIMDTLVRTEITKENEVVQEQIRDYYARIKMDAIVEGIEFVKEKSLDFAKGQKLKSAILKSVPLIEKGSYDEIRKLIEHATNLGLDNDLGHDYIVDFEKRYEPTTRDPFSTGWPLIDAITKGGFGRGELICAISYTGGGKSFALVNLAAQALKQGKKVVYYTLELSEEEVGLRFDSLLSGVRLDDLLLNKKQILESIQKYKDLLIIKQYPSRKTPLSTITNHWDKLIQKGFKPDVVVYDYLDLLKPTRVGKEKRYELEEMYEEVRGIAMSTKTVGITCSQTNRSGLNSEIITMDAISEAYSKCFPSDFIFTISRTMQEYANDAGKMFVAKSRLGRSNCTFNMHIDLSKAFMDIDSEITGTVDEINENNLQQNEQVVKDKYAEYKIKNGKKK